MEFFKNRHCPFPAVAELTSEHLSKPLEKSGDDASVHVVHGAELSQPFLVAL